MTGAEERAARVEWGNIPIAFRPEWESYWLGWQARAARAGKGPYTFDCDAEVIRDADGIIVQWKEILACLNARAGGEQAIVEAARRISPDEWRIAVHEAEGESRTIASKLRALASAVEAQPAPPREGKP